MRWGIYLYYDFCVCVCVRDVYDSERDTKYICGDVSLQIAICVCVCVSSLWAWQKKLFSPQANSISWMGGARQKKRRLTCYIHMTA